MSNFSKELEDVLNKPENAEAKALLLSVKKGESFGTVPRRLLEYPEVAEVARKEGLSGAYWTGMVSDAWMTFND